MMILGDLLSAEGDQDLNKTLKRAFFSDTPVVIDDHIQEALIILINLTRSVSESTDLVNMTAAKVLFMDEKWHEGVMATVSWVATHYIKDPNSRAIGCVRCLPECYGENGQKYLGWSHNSNKVSRSHFLATEFCWKNRVTSLYEQFSNGEKNKLIEALTSLGFPSDKIKQLQGQCRGGMSNTVPEFVSPYSKVLLFPDGSGDYVAVTPLVSANFQRWVHNLVGHPDIHCRPVFYSRPFQISSFMGACGGRLFCLYYPPRLGRRDHNLQYLLDRWRLKKNMLNIGSLFHKRSLSFLLQLASGKKVVESEKKTDERLASEASQLKGIVEEVFSFLFMLRAHYLTNQNLISQTFGESFELTLIQDGWSHSDKVVYYFLSQLNDMLERSRYSAQLAYNPVLLPLLEKAVKKTLRKINKQPETSKVSGKFLHFKRLMAYSANARSNPYVIGLPSLTAWAGLVHAFLCNLGYKSDRIDFRFAVVLRKYGLNEGHPLPAQEIKNRKLSNSPVIDHRSCDLEFDLVVQIPSFRDEIDLTEDNLYCCLPSRFAGGTLTHPVEGSYGKCDLYRRCDIYGSVEELSASLLHLPTYAKIISSVCNAPDQAELLKQLSQGKAIPIGSGFHFLNCPEKRVGVEGYLHAFSGSVLSLVSLESVHTVNPLGRSLWSITYSDSGIEVSVEDGADGDSKAV